MKKVIEFLKKDVSEDPVAAIILMTISFVFSTASIIISLYTILS